MSEEPVVSKKHKGLKAAALVDIAYALHRLADAQADIASAERSLAATAGPMHLATTEWYRRLNEAHEDGRKAARNADA